MTGRSGNGTPRESALLRLKRHTMCYRQLLSFNPFQGICPSAASMAPSASSCSMLFQSLPGNLPFCGSHGCTTPSPWHTSFNPFQGICPSAASPRRPTRHLIRMFQSLPGNLPFCGLAPACPWPMERSCFNPFQGICPSAAGGSVFPEVQVLLVSIPSRESALLRLVVSPALHFQANSS